MSMRFVDVNVDRSREMAGFVRVDNKEACVRSRDPCRDIVGRGAIAIHEKVFDAVRPVDQPDESRNIVCCRDARIHGMSMLGHA